MSVLKFIGDAKNNLKIKRLRHYLFQGKFIIAANFDKDMTKDWHKTVALYSIRKGKREIENQK